MNVYQLGPVKELSRAMQRRLRENNLYFDSDWYIVVQLLEETHIETAVTIDKYRVGAPYKFKVRGLLKGDASVTRANMNDFVMVIGIPLEFAKENHNIEVEQALRDANKLLAKAADEAQPSIIVDNNDEETSLVDALSKTSLVDTVVNALST